MCTSAVIFVTIDALHDVSLNDPSCANEGEAADMTIAEGLWWKGERIAVPNSVDTKQPNHEIFHDHPMAGTFWSHQDFEAITAASIACVIQGGAWLHA